jgi:hypothetical protein
MAVSPTRPGAGPSLEMQDVTQIMAFQDEVLTGPQRWQIQHRASAKNTGGWVRCSRKKKHQKLRAPSRCSRHVYHAATPASQELKAFMQRPHIQDALAALHRVRAECRGHAPPSAVASAASVSSGLDQKVCTV